MPGVVMENGDRNGSHTNHDRDNMPNGLSSVSNGLDATYDKGKGKATLNGGGPQDAPDHSLSRELGDQLHHLPPEIQHITEGFLSLPVLLVRRAQVAHNNLNQIIQQLASMPSPSPAMNGNAHVGTLGDDAAQDLLDKKVALLRFAEKEHSDWVKALVITSWSRVAEDVQRLIDLKVHIDAQRLHYEWAVENLVELKRGLINARLPNPDLKTALEVLSSGKASWMPDLGYLPSPPLTGKELMKSFKDLNTLLLIRVNLHDYDKLPPFFKNFSIRSGRVTFRVEGEFEVDLTIADEDPATQFWFIDFRFIFSPQLGEIHENLLGIIEGRVNSVLEKDGLEGAYRFLHELTLTHKIGEMRRQATDMGRGRWIESVRAEGLHRALSIQYWSNRFELNAPKNWIILGVHSGRSKDGKVKPSMTSFIKMRWFRDQKEVKDFDISLEVNDIDVETLIQDVVQQHTLHILSKLYEELKKRPLYQQGRLSVRASFLGPKPELEDMHLKLQWTLEDTIRLSIEPITGRFIISGGSRYAANLEQKLNNQVRDAASLATELDNFRCGFVSERLCIRAASSGWALSKTVGISNQALKNIVPRDTLQISWLRRPGWNQEWLVAFTSSMSGERFWLFQTTGDSRNLRIVTHIQIPTDAVTPPITYEFFTALHLLSSALVSYHTNLKNLHTLRVPHRAFKRNSDTINAGVSLPIIFATLSKIITFTGRPWARDVMKMSFHGLESVRPKRSIPEATNGGDNTLQTPTPPRAAPVETAILVAQAMMTSPMPASLDVVKHQVDRDIAFHPTSGVFAVRLHHKIGEPAIPQLREKVQRVEQLVQFVRTAKKHNKTLYLENISLEKVDLSYDKAASTSPMNDSPPARHLATIAFGQDKEHMSIHFETGNPHIRLLDYFTKILNMEGLDGVATMLPLTLPVLRAFDTIEEKWTSVENGEALLLTRAVDWHVIRYTMALQSAGGPIERKLDIEIKLSHRGSEPWWLIRRAHRSQQQADFIDKALSSKVWDANGDGDGDWRGMQTSAIAQRSGVEGVLLELDEAIRNIASQPAPVEEPATVAPPADSQPEATQAIGQQQQQRPSQNQQQQTQPQSKPQIMGQANMGIRPPQPSQNQQQAYQNFQRMNPAQMNPQMRQQYMQMQQAQQQRMAAQAAQQRNQQQGKQGNRGKSEAIVID